MALKVILTDMSAEILQIAPRHLPAVAVVHSRAFPDSALTRLGLGAVRRYYEWQLAGPHEHHFIGAFNETGLMGFAVGGISRAALAGFVRRNKWYLVTRIMVTPRLLLSKRGWKAMVAGMKGLRRLRVLAKAPPRPQAAVRSFGILAIAVDPAYQGKGIGLQLMARCERIARHDHFTRMHLTVNVSNTQAIRFYEKLAWAKVPGGEGWTGAMEKILS
jgi:ribosomal protein S18 acetylase RimI-like enzyme